MNTEEKAIEPFILPSDEMFNKIIVAPEKYPIMVLHPKISQRHLRQHTKVFHVFPVERRNEKLRGIVHGYYKKMPISAKQPKKLKAYKEKRNIPDVGDPLDKIIETPEGDHFFLYKKSLPTALVDEMAETFWVSRVEYEGEMRRGVLCVYLKPMNLTDNPLEENEVRIIGSWIE